MVVSPSMEAEYVSTPHGGLATQFLVYIKNIPNKVSTPHGGLATG